MIRCLIVQISRNSRDQPVRKEQLITGETIQIGRAAECKVLLADARVSLHHATIRHGIDNKLYIDGFDGEELYVNDSFQRHAECVPGTQIRIGSFNLTIEPHQVDCDLVLSITPIDFLQTRSTVSSKRYPLTLASAGLKKRRPAVWLSVLVALFFLILPLIQSVATMQSKKEMALPVSFLELWSLGQMSHGHRSFAGQCRRCHIEPFSSVPDKTCESCHVSTANHIQDKNLHHNAFKNMRCVACHPDHRGEAPMAKLDAQCVSCHGEIKSLNSKSTHANIHDFSLDHPAFKLTLKTGHQDKEVIRISQENKTSIVEKSGLKFSHQVHLDKSGVSSPNGDVVMGCQDCHELDDAGMRFQAITMAKSCQQSGCHTLDFTPPVTDRVLPHGSEQKLMTTLNEYYAKASIDEMLTGKTRQCGNAPTTGTNLLERALSCANNKVTVNTKFLFDTKEGCVECHDVSANTDDKNVPWKIKPVNMTRHWLSNADFPHSKHSTAKCTDCHDKSKSKKSADVSIPEIGKCRECHVGTKAVKGKVSSSCEKCHAFHAEDNQRNSGEVVH